MDKVEKIIFATLVAVGCLFVFLVPPFQKPDENRHYYQVEAISRGNFRCHSDEQGAYLPLPADVAGFPAQFKTSEVAHTYTNKFERSLIALYPYDHSEIIKERNWCSPSIIGYLPNLPGILLGRLVNSKLASVYLSRLSAFLIFLIVLILARKRTPKSFHSWLYFFALTPMTLHQVTAVSYDALLLTLIPLVISSLLRPSARPYLFWGVLATLPLVKIAYTPFLLLGFFTKREYWLKFFLVALIIISLLTLLPAPHFSEYPLVINPEIQTSIILRDPLHFVSASLATVNQKFTEIITSLVGNFGWLDYTLHPLWYHLYFAVFLYLVASAPKLKLSLSQIITVCLVVLATISAVFASLYLYWTQPGFNLVSGIQGRYFLPVLPLLMLFMTWLWQNYRVKLTVLFSLVITIYLTSLVYFRYYDYSHYGQNDLTPILADNLSGDHYTLTIPGVRAKLVGFYYYTTDPVSPTRYLVMDSNCQKVLRSGYLQNIMANSNHEYQEEFTPIWVGTETCLKLVPLTSGSFPTHAVAPLYLIPSLSP